jgi:hypothetical protein
MNRADPSTLIGSSGLTATQMGQLTAAYNADTLAALNTGVDQAKPGKLAYALSYRGLLAKK